MSSPVLRYLQSCSYLVYLHHSPACRVYTGISLPLFHCPGPSPAYARQRSQRPSSWWTSASFSHSTAKMEGGESILTCAFGSPLCPAPHPWMLAWGVSWSNGKLSTYSCSYMQPGNTSNSQAKLQSCIGSNTGSNSSSPSNTSLFS